MNTIVLMILLILVIAAMLIAPIADNNRIVFGVLLLVAGALFFYCGWSAETEEPQYDLLDVLLILPMLFKLLVCSMKGIVEETLGASMSITGAWLLAAGCIEEHKQRKQQADFPPPEIDKDGIYEIMHSEQPPGNDDDTDAE